MAPDQIFEELMNNIHVMYNKTKYSYSDLKYLFSIIERRMTIIPESDYLSFVGKAMRLCPDIKDIMYFALAMYLKCPIWSNDKRLKRQPFIKVFSTHELLKMFNL